MLCKIWGLHGSDYEECRFLGYKTIIRTSQEKHYLSTTEANWLMLCKIWGFNGGDYEECSLLGYEDVCFVRIDISEEFTRATRSHIQEDAILHLTND
jgi:hypothetical protein